MNVAEERGIFVVRGGRELQSFGYTELSGYGDNISIPRSFA